LGHAWYVLNRSVGKMNMIMGGNNGIDDYIKMIVYLFPFPAAKPVVVGPSPFAKLIASLFPLPSR
jgi:hypothetical protein